MYNDSNFKDYLKSILKNENKKPEDFDLCEEDITRLVEGRELKLLSMNCLKETVERQMEMLDNMGIEWKERPFKLERKHRESFTFMVEMTDAEYDALCEKWNNNGN